jgi:PD-(D/E)XK nuclease superfamily
VLIVTFAIRDSSRTSARRETLLLTERYLDWLPAGHVEEVEQPAQLPLPDDAPRPLPIEVMKTAEWSVTDGRLISYKSCPRRFFYTHVMGLRSARKATAFSRTHECLYELIRWVAVARKNSEPRLEEAVAAFEKIWQSKGPLLTEDAFAPDYHRLHYRGGTSASTAIAAESGGSPFRGMSAGPSFTSVSRSFP